MELIEGYQLDALVGRCRQPRQCECQRLAFHRLDMRHQLTWDTDDTRHLSLRYLGTVGNVSTTAVVSKESVLAVGSRLGS